MFGVKWFFELFFMLVYLVLKDNGRLYWLNDYLGKIKKELDNLE